MTCMPRRMIVLKATSQGKGKLALNNESVRKLRGELGISETASIDINLRIKGKTFPAVSHVSSVRYDKKSRSYKRTERITIPKRVVRGAKLKKGNIRFILREPVRHQQVKRQIVYPSVAQRAKQIEFFWVENVIFLDANEVWATLLRDMRSAPRGYDSVGASLFFAVDTDAGEILPMVLSFPETPLDIAYKEAPNQFAKFVKLFVDDAIDRALLKLEQPYVRNIILVKHTVTFTKPLAIIPRGLRFRKKMRG